MKINPTNLSQEQIDSVKAAEKEREKALDKWQGEIISIISDFYMPFIENPPFNEVEIEVREEILSIAGNFIEKMRELAIHEYDVAHHCYGPGYDAEKEITDKDELLSIKGIFAELSRLYQEYAHATAWKRDKVIEKTQWIKYLLTSWLYDQEKTNIKNCLNNYRNLYTIIETINSYGEELQLRDFSRIDCMWFYGILLETAIRGKERSDDNILSIFVVFINKNVKKEKLYDNIAKGSEDNKDVMEGSLKRTDCEGIFKLEKTNNSYKVIKTSE